MALVKSGLSRCYKKLHFSPPPMPFSLEVDSKPSSDLRSQISALHFKPWPRRARKRFVFSSILILFVFGRQRELCGSLKFTSCGAFNTLLFCSLLVLFIIYLLYMWDVFCFVWIFKKHDRIKIGRLCGSY